MRYTRSTFLLLTLGCYSCGGIVISTLSYTPDPAALGPMSSEQVAAALAELSITGTNTNPDWGGDEAFLTAKATVTVEGKNFLLHIPYEGTPIEVPGTAFKKAFINTSCDFLFEVPIDPAAWTLEKNTADLFMGVAMHPQMFTAIVPADHFRVLQNCDSHFGGGKSMVGFSFTNEDSLHRFLTLAAVLAK